MNTQILVVDDEPLIRWSLKERLTPEGCDVVEAGTGASAKLAVTAQTFDAALVDLRLPDTDGLKLMLELRGLQPELPVIMITAYSSVESAVRALKLGAIDYVTKPFDVDALWITLRRVLEQASLRRTVDVDLRQKNEQFGVERIVGESAGMREVKELVRRIAGAPSASTVLLLGESGTGKDLVARALHYDSARAAHPFMNITCTALNEGLLESELFGHEAGAFTGAGGRKKGLFEMAHHGTVFLDEVGDMPPLLQSKLLRVLEEKSFKRIGGTTDIRVDVRIVAATHQDLEQQVQARQFRQDLYFRLNILPIFLPPLRARREDIGPIAQHFLGVYAREFKRVLRGFTAGALARLEAHSWPGNVRELRNVVERAALLGSGEVIGEGDLVLGKPQLNGAITTDAGTLPGENCTLAVAEQFLIRRALERSRGNLTQAGRLLGITRDQVRYKLEKFGMRIEEGPPGAGG